MAMSQARELALTFANAREWTASVRLRRGGSLN